MSRLNKNTFYKWENIGFSLVVLILFVIMNVLEFGSGNTVYVKYSIVCLCFAQSFIGICTRQRGWLFSVALLFTCFADYFLLVTGQNYAVGMACFLVTQTYYYCYILQTAKPKLLPHLLIPFVAVAAAVAVLFILNSADAASLIAAPYFVLLIANCVSSWIYRKKLPYGTVLALGFTLFIGCDVCTLLHNVVNYGFLLPEKVAIVALYAIWEFYAPSQALIVLSQTLQNKTKN